ncbi:MAG TPA: hypothetical protein VNP98_10260 [Chthoniobacterales bacterium]|nr:hypothetical protein [Chthoniobacterales bacterium]
MAALLIIGGVFGLLRSEDMVIFHATGDMVGAQSGLLEIANSEAVHFYAITALSLGMGLVVFMVWALKTTNDDTSN